MNKKIPLIIIAGPTGIGKSNLALTLAQDLKTDIISADSRQIYKDFDIGTAKPDIDEQSIVKHHLIDICDPREVFSLSQYTDIAKNTIQDIYNKNKIPLLVGGTGLYIKTLIEGFSVPEVEPDYKLRSELTEKSKAEGNDELYRYAQSIDPKAMEKIHKNDLIRIIRVIEVFKNTGKKFSELGKKSNEPVYDIIYVGLDIDREKLYKRIGLRVDQMIQLGLIDEVTNIIDKYGPELPLLKTINYREIKQFLDKELSLEDAIELMKKDTRNFAKRQLTWFRNDQYIKFFNCETQNELNTIMLYIKEKISLLEL